MELVQFLILNNWSVYASNVVVMKMRGCEALSKVCN